MSSTTPDDAGSDPNAQGVDRRSEAALIRRLNQAVGPDYEVVRLLGGGGMGVVFLARDTALDRVVAIKAIRPELATEAAVQRFLREARILARIHHPNIVPIHRAGTADGLPYYVMEYVEGETLADRLGRGALGERDAITVGRALLGALSAAHAEGVVHRDVKPANIFLAGDRVLLGDFGVAHVETTDPDTTATGGHVGTPAYMAPEQATSGIATEQTDEYAAGMVIYEMLTGRRWVPVAAPAQADWTGVSRHFRGPLRRAMAWDPGRRWDRASAFRRALSPRYRVLRRATISGWVVALVAVVAMVSWLWWTQRTPELLPIADLAILPFEVLPTPDDELGVEMAGRINFALPDVPQLIRAPTERTVRWWNAASAADRIDPSTICREIRAHWCALGRIHRDGNHLEVNLSVVDENGLVVYDMEGLEDDSDDRARLAEAMAHWLLGKLAPGFTGTLRSTSALSVDKDAVRSYFQGEHAFLNDRQDLAINHYKDALSRDPTFALARWHLVNAWRWQPAETPDLRPHLEELAATGVGRLGTLDSMLVQAQLLPPGDARLNAYRAAADAYPIEAFPRMLLGEELFHRGPLAGHPFDTAAVVLEEAVALDPLLAPAHELLAWLYIRTGRQEEARRSLDTLDRILEHSTRSSQQYAALLRQAWQERFYPESARRARDALLAVAPSAGQEPGFYLRMAFAFDMPGAQAEYGTAMLTSPNAAVRASGHYGIALADAARGGWQSALLHLDSATALLGTDSARLFAAEFRVVLPAIGMFPFGTVERERGLRALEQLVEVPATEVRAAWALALDALSPPMVGSRRDTARAARERDRLRRHPSDSVALRLGGMLDAMMLRPGKALAASDWLLEYDAHGQHGDPFARAALHLLRAEWHTALLDRPSAIRELRWAENLDIVAWPGGQPQAVEIDWIMSVDASNQRGRLAFRPPALIARRLGDRWPSSVDPEALADTVPQPAAGCAQLERVRSFWGERHQRYPKMLFDRWCRT